MLDINKFVLGFQKSTFGTKQRQLAKSVMSITQYDIPLHLQTSAFGTGQQQLTKSATSITRGNAPGFNVHLLSKTEAQEIDKYMKQIPDRLAQNLQLHQQDLSEFQTKKYNYIFATQSLLYALLDVRGSRQKFLRRIVKYLGALKTNGSLIIDEFAYTVIREEIRTIPDPNIAPGKSVRWSYTDNADSTTHFTTTRFCVPNTTRDTRRTPVLFYHDAERQTRIMSTTDIYTLTRLAHP